MNANSLDAGRSIDDLQLASAPKHPVARVTGFRPGLYVGVVDVPHTKEMKIPFVDGGRVSSEHRAGLVPAREPARKGHPCCRRSLDISQDLKTQPLSRIGTSRRNVKTRDDQT